MKKVLYVVVGVVILASVVIAARGTSSTPPNLITNPSLELAHGAQPSGWHSGSWGTNTSDFTYDTGSAADGTRTVTASITDYTSGAAEWVPLGVAVRPGQYHFQDSYRASVPTEVGGTVTYADGHTSYLYIGTLPASTTTSASDSSSRAAYNWQHASLTVNVPSGALSLTVFQAIYGIGFVQSDQYSLSVGAAPSNGAPTSTSGSGTSPAGPHAGATSTSQETTITSSSSQTTTT